MGQEIVRVQFNGFLIRLESPAVIPQFAECQAILEVLLRSFSACCCEDINFLYLSTECNGLTT